MAGTKLFISHASGDKLLIEAFVELLEVGVGVSHRDIFCSSLKGQGIRPGTDFKSSIREHLDDASCVIALISPSFYNSAFCMCELGGVWLQAKSFLPILVPPVGFGDLKAVLGGIQAIRLGEPSDLDELRDELSSRIEVSAHSTTRWNSRRDAFLRSLPDLLTKVPQPVTISADDLAAIKDKLVESEKAAVARDGELRSALVTIKSLADQLNSAHADLYSERESGRGVAEQRKEAQADVNRLRSELREAQASRDAFVWVAESRLELSSCGRAADKFDVTWSFCVKNVGKNQVCLLTVETRWCLLKENGSEVMVNDEPFTSSFPDQLALAPGERSKSYQLKVDTRTLNAEFARRLVDVVRPRVIVYFSAIGGPYRATAERLLARESEIEQ